MTRKKQTTKYVKVHITLNKSLEIKSEILSEIKKGSEIKAANIIFMSN